MNKSKGVNIAENKLSNPPPCLSVLDQRVVNLGMTHVLDSYYTYNDVVRFIWDNGGYCSQILSLSLSSDVFRYSYDGSAHDNQRILATIRLSGLSGKPELLVGRTPLELSSQNQATITPEMMDGDSLTIVASLGGFSDTKIITKLRDAPSLENLCINCTMLVSIISNYRVINPLCICRPILPVQPSLVFF